MRTVLVPALVVAIAGLAAGGFLAAGEPAGTLATPTTAQDGGRQAGVAPGPRHGDACARGVVEACLAHDGRILDLAARLEAGSATPALRSRRRPSPRAPERHGLVLARRMERRICPGTDRGDQCHVAVASEAIRRLWRDLRSAGSRRTAEVLLGLGVSLRMTAEEVGNAVRAELDEELTRAVRRDRLGARGRRVALACFDAPGSCARAGPAARRRPGARAR